VPSYIAIRSPSGAYDPKVRSFISIASFHKLLLTLTHIFHQFFSQRTATITAPARIGFGAPTSGITNSQGKGKGAFATKLACISAAVFVASTALSDTTPGPTVVYICS
jgi:hypothetical protein